MDKEISPDNISPIPHPPQSKLGKAWWWLVHFAFRLLYNEMAWTYDVVSWVVSLGQWRDWQQTSLKHLNIDAGGIVLEMAHGTGNLQLDLAKAGYRRLAFDVSPHMGQIASRKLRKNHLTPNFVRAKAQAMPFATSSVDAIVSTFPTPFIIELETLQEAHRVLRPRGRLVIVPNAVLTKGGLAKEALETAYRVTGQRGPWAVDLETRFREAGFELSFVAEPCRWSMAQVLVAQRIELS